MPKQTIVVASDNKKAVEYVSTYFSDTQSVATIIRSKSDVSTLFSHTPNLVFFQGDWLDAKLASKLQELKKGNQDCKFFALGNVSADGVAWDAHLELPIDDRHFRKSVLGAVTLPDPIKLVVVDDEADIIEIVQDYFEVRKDPPFQVRTAYNGLEGYKLVEQDPPHCMVLDIKMPVRTGVELYRDLARAGYRIPTVIFIDSTNADDILEIRKWGAPVFAEKGSPSSAMPEMLALVKKLVAFS